tara:strand:+ start:464 stop:1147 length:684 start_codon:yes stop_codon:yes gene_type:complete
MNVKMSEDLLNDPECRYCLCKDDEYMIIPCKCDGSMKYVHEQCLLNWIEKKNRRVVIPGRFGNSSTFHCEICQTEYKVDYINEQKGNLYLDVIKYFSLITICLFGSYFGFGYAMKNMDILVFTYMEDEGYWHNILWNGFCLTHIIIGLYYILCSTVHFCSNAYCYCCFPSFDTDNADIGMLCIIIIGIGILMTILCIYMDVISSVIQRHYNNCRKITRINNYRESKV